MADKEMQSVNESDFIKMAYGDLEGFKELASEFFADIHARQPGWRELLDRQAFHELGEELHRCKGGASIFGMDRVVAMIKAVEGEGVLEIEGFDLPLFQKEIQQAEKTIAIIRK